MSAHKYPIHTFLRYCIIIYEEFGPSIIYRFCAVLFRKQVYSKPWRSENSDIIAELSMWPADRIEAAYDFIYGFFKHPIKRGSVKDKILFGASYVASSLRHPEFINHAIVLSAFYRCCGSPIALFYLKKMPESSVAEKADLWLAHLAEDRHDRELADGHIAALMYLMENVHRYESDWFYNSEFRRRIKVLRSTGTHHTLNSIYMIGR